MNKISNLVNKKLSEKEEEEKEKAEQAEKATASPNEVQAPQASEPKKRDYMTTAEALEGANKIKQDYENGKVSSAPESLGLEKIEIADKDEEDFKKEAENSLKDKYNNEREKTESSFKSKVDELLGAMDSAKQKNKETEKKLNEYYDNSIKETENQALRRGLARSSIIIGQISNLEGSRANELANALSNLESSLSDSEKKIGELNSSLESALDSLDIEEAEKIQEQIGKLKESYEKEKQEAIKFNNNVLKLEAEYKKDLEKQKQEMQKEDLALKDKYGVSYLEREMKQKQFDYLKNYLDTLDKNYALNLLLTNKEFKNVLAENYSTMYKYLNSKD